VTALLIPIVPNAAMRISWNSANAYQANVLVLITLSMKALSLNVIAIVSVMAREDVILMVSVRIVTS
jgi:hypothetical protein